MHGVLVEYAILDIVEMENIPQSGEVEKTSLWLSWVRLPLHLYCVLPDSVFIII